MNKYLQAAWQKPTNDKGSPFRRKNYENFVVYLFLTLRSFLNLHLNYWTLDKLRSERARARGRARARPSSEQS